MYGNIVLQETFITNNLIYKKIVLVDTMLTIKQTNLGIKN